MTESNARHGIEAPRTQRMSSSARLAMLYADDIQVLSRGIAMKLDASMHIQEFNGSTERYPEIRFDVSYIFGR